VPEIVRKLYFGDNLKVLRESVPDESVDLIYLDPPFNSKKIYNVNFGADAQIKAFVDNWQWSDESVVALDDIRNKHNVGLYDLIFAIKDMVGENGLSAYIVMMTIRLLELKRVLKPTGSIYLHCDSVASHYLKVVMDSIFGIKNFQNSIVWKRTSAHNDTKGWGRIQDNILFYTKSEEYVWNKVYTEYNDDYVKKFYRYTDENGRRYRLGDLTATGIRKGESGMPWKGVDPTKKGNHWAIRRTFLNDPDIPDSTLEALNYLDSIGRIYWPKKGKVPSLIRYLDEMPGSPIQDIITDIPPLSAQSKEKLGYPTQKPLTLLERIISVSSNKGDVVLDPFCGCGTAIEAAEKLDRQWIGIDITCLAVLLVERRLNEGFRHKPIKWDVYGLPVDMESAIELARRDKYQFQYWACRLLYARPIEEDKKGKDKGVDGVILFNDEGPRAKAKKIIISVKGGANVTSSMVRDLRGTVERENAVMGLFVTLTKPTKDMKNEAASAGVYRPPLEVVSDGHMYGVDVMPKIQIVTIEDLLQGGKPKLPNDLTLGGATFKKNRTVANEAPKPNGFNLD
jgi:site-specific DNA-methyltransferase (adenine-specific)